jgi:YVTN family beta-propeller protein
MKKHAILFLCVCTYMVTFAKGGRHHSGKAAAAYHHWYDDSTMLVHGGPMLLPYNRYIDPVGKMVRFGNPDKENHALDCALIPDTKFLAVEERYGVAIINTITGQVVREWEYGAHKVFKEMRSTYSGIKAIKMNGEDHIFWSAASADTKRSLVLDAIWTGVGFDIVDTFAFEAFQPAPLALPNEIVPHYESGEYYLYVVLNGNNQLVKIRISDKQIIWTMMLGKAPYGIAIAGNKAYISNWAGPYPIDVNREMAGIPYGKAYIDHRTGAVQMGTVSVVDLREGRMLPDIAVGLHPSAVAVSPDAGLVCVVNGNSDYVSMIDTKTDRVVQTISVKLNQSENGYSGDEPNALAFAPDGKTLYVSNGMDNAVAVIDMSYRDNPQIAGFLPTGAYPAGLAVDSSNIYVCNLEGEGARVSNKGTYNSHRELATISVIPLAEIRDLPALTKRVEDANLQFRVKLSQVLPRSNVKPQPVPDRIGEPSTIKHIIYIIKENRTYDQVLGDMKEGDGMSSLCIFGDSVTVNEHKLAREFGLLDNYYASGKSSAEGHQWADAGMVSDYVEKSVRAWFRSYPHVQNDAMVYNKEGFIWNNALDHGKTVRIYGEACEPQWEGGHNWKDVYKLYQNKKPFVFKNQTTLSRVEPILSQEYPCGDVIEIPDQMRADAFIKDLKQMESVPGDIWPQLMVLALPNDHTAGTSQSHPTPAAMVADNDLALGRIVDAVSHSRFWDSTAIFVTEDDSQDGWDHISAYRTTGFVISPYSRLARTIHTDYNQTCMLRTIEQILGLPPMNVIDATALPMFDCFSDVKDNTPYFFVTNKVPLDEMNKAEGYLHGEELNYARLSNSDVYAHIDGGDDDNMNKILWHYARGRKHYPRSMTLPQRQRDDD